MSSEDLGTSAQKPKKIKIYNRDDDGIGDGKTITLANANKSEGNLGHFYHSSASPGCIKTTFCSLDY